MSETNMVFSMDVLKALNPDATSKTEVEFDTRGSIHLIERDDEGNEISDYEVRDKHFVDFSDIPSLDKRLMMVKKESRIANIKFGLVVALLASLLSLAIYTIVYFS